MAPSSYELEPEEDIFAGIDYVFEEPNGEDLLLSAKLKAQQQLAVSSDSPFSGQDPQQNGIFKMFRERAMLKQEAEKILKERESIKGRQTDIREEVARKPVPEERSPQRVPEKASQETSKKLPKQPETQLKFRPLTGRIDCPNCSCDARSSSVCSVCIKMDRRASIFLGSTVDMSRGDRTSGNTLTDNKRSQRCTLKELKQRYPSRAEEKPPVVVSDRVVPGRVYTISKALDDKRAKLAQAIVDLQLMKEELRKKSDRLDEERKVVQLYRDQWRYGPSIGGPKSSSHERLGPVKQPRNYQSRLDPQLARDSKALEGFRHIEPGLKLRQYDKKPVVERPLTSSRRAKSLESLARSPQRQPPASNKTLARNSPVTLSKSLSPASNKKSSSDVDLSSPPEAIEEEISAIDTSPPASVVEEKLEEEAEEEVCEEQEEEGEEQDEQAKEQVNDKREPETRVHKVAWIPVFGQTEIKTVRQKPRVGKIEALATPKESRSILKQPNATKSNKSKEPNKQRLVGEASRKLKFASDLLSQERQDSGTKNQLVVRRSSPKRALLKPTDAQPQSEVEHQATEQDRNNKLSNELKIREMLLIEEQLNEHQKQITKLVEMQQSSAGKTVPTKAACCSHPNKIPLGNKSLINNLRDRLNKTKTRLSRNLEAEREKYMRLKLKVDNSLRKQSDLEKENELLKQSLSQCIDTCLKDITQTFEALSNTLADSVGSPSPGRPSVGVSGGESRDLLEIYSPDSGNLLLKNAAQVMSDNNKIKEMKSRMDSVMEQRREIFNELSKEKQKSNQLELQLKRSQDELGNLMSAKKKLELRLQQEELRHSPQPAPPLPSTSSASDASPAPVDDSTATTTTTSANDNPLESLTEDTFSGSIDRYRSYIKSLSPDMATLRQERKLILNEFDNIKKMLSEINTPDSKID